MKVLVAGATGAIGKPLIHALLAAGHETVGLTSSDSGRAALTRREQRASWQMRSIPRLWTQPSDM